VVCEGYRCLSDDAIGEMSQAPTGTAPGYVAALRLKLEDVGTAYDNKRGLGLTHRKSRTSRST